MDPIDRSNETMSDTEAERVLSLLEEWRRNREEQLARPTVRDMAVLSNCSEEDVARALSQVRQANIPPVHPPAGPVPLAPNQRRGVFFALTAVFIGVLMMFGGLLVTSARHHVIAPPPPIEATVAEGSVSTAPVHPGSPVHVETSVSSEGSGIEGSASTSN